MMDEVSIRPLGDLPGRVNDFFSVIWHCRFYVSQLTVSKHCGKHKVLTTSTGLASFFHCLMYAYSPTSVPCCHITCIHHHNEDL